MASISFLSIPATLIAWCTVGIIFCSWALEASSGTTPPYFRLSNKAYGVLSNYLINGTTVTLKDLVNSKGDLSISLCFKSDYHTDDGRTVLVLGDYSISGDDYVLSQGIEITVHEVKIKSDKASLSLPLEDNSLDAIISSYAFHHLTDDEKLDAVKLFKSKLKSDGTIVFADTIYASEEAKDALIKEAYFNRHISLAKDLENEFYTTQESLTNIFESQGFSVSYQQMNKFVWILTAKLK